MGPNIFDRRPNIAYRLLSAYQQARKCITLLRVLTRMCWWGESAGWRQTKPQTGSESSWDLNLHFFCFTALSLSHTRTHKRYIWAACVCRFPTDENGKVKEGSWSKILLKCWLEFAEQWITGRLYFSLCMCVCPFLFFYLCDNHFFPEYGHHFTQSANLQGIKFSPQHT